MNIGITGTRSGTTLTQLSTGFALIMEQNPVTIHHGDCVGADAEVDHLARPHIPVIIHPPLDSKYRAWCGPTDIPPKLYHVRNHDIVNETDILFAFPDGPERNRSGTWSTVRYATITNKPVTIIYPDGRIEQRSNT